MVGLGYIGLPTATLLAQNGVIVHGVDVNPVAVEAVKAGTVHIFEPDLDSLVREVVLEGRLTASLEPQPADVFILAVPTPFKANHEADISYVEAATRSIAPFLAPRNLVILESTSPVGTTERVAELLSELRPDLRIPRRNAQGTGEDDVSVAYCPERVLPGRILKELVENDRIVGGIDTRSALVARDFYRLFVKGIVLPTDSRTAELCKLTENSFRDVNIAFANELSLICDRLNVDVWNLIDLANRHPRVNILQPGPGVGGHCIAVDPWFIVQAAPEQSRLIRTAREVNDSKPHYVVSQIRRAIADHEEPAVACLGLAFKADIDDLRESPAVEIVQSLSTDSRVRVLVAEPHCKSLPGQLATRPNVSLCDVGNAITRADVVVLLVNHQAFRSITSNQLMGKRVLDTRGFWR